MTDCGDATLDTASGKRISLREPDPEAIDLDDVAGALSRVCRFAAQAHDFYSVAQHAIHVQSLVEEWGRPDLSLAALHHDSHEAFICDVPTPLKRLLSSATATYEDIAMRLDAAIAMAFGFRVPHGDDKLLIERADRQAFLVEVKALMPALAERIRHDEGLELDRLEELDSPLPPLEAKERFEDAHRRAETRHASRSAGIHRDAL